MTRYSDMDQIKRDIHLLHAPKMGVKDLFFNLFVSSKSICLLLKTMSRRGTNDEACFQ